jgi:hypothetical protein
VKPGFNWEKYPLMVGAAVCVFFSVRLYQDGQDENLTAAAVLLGLGAVCLGAFLVMVALDWARKQDREDDGPGYTRRR